MFYIVFRVMMLSVVSLSGDPMNIPAWIMIIITDGGMEDGTVARCLPLLVGLSEDITHIKETLNVAMDKVARVEMEVVLKLNLKKKIIKIIFL